MIQKWREMDGKQRLKHVILYFLSVSVMPLGIVLTINGHLGAGGIDAMNFAMAEKLGVNTSVAVYITAFTSLVIAALIRKGKPNLLAFVTSFFNGLFTDFWKYVLAGLEGTDFLSSLLLFLAGLILVGFAVACIVVSIFPAGPVDDVMVAMSERGWKIWKSKILIEATGVAAALLLGGEIGLGTILFTFGLGPIVDQCCGLIRKMAFREEAAMQE